MEHGKTERHSENRISTLIKTKALRSQRLLFVAVCRALGIAARFDPHSGAAEYAPAADPLRPPRHIIHAAAGYRIGSIDTALSFCRGWQTESPHRPRAQ